ncbi:hypothetical protein M6B38_159785 [Iris pallida]|uniref:Uncharacterized protein n=1 Tax=Iris pallida TaxID=29817 RepID=A0AAX6F175_IRIPA|nr:hypothetical protein M6B38_159785 [Iris pallida]
MGSLAATSSVEAHVVVPNLVKKVAPAMLMLGSRRRLRLARQRRARLLPNFIVILFFFRTYEF